jgi:hypothetical protein
VDDAELRKSSKNAPDEQNTFLIAVMPDHSSKKDAEDNAQWENMLQFLF